MSAKNQWDVDEIVVERGGKHFEGDRWLYVGTGQEIGYVSEEAPGGADAWTAMFKASPAMVRALLAQGEIRHGKWHTILCWRDAGDCIPSCQALLSALASAGVPLS